MKRSTTSKTFGARTHPRIATFWPALNRAISARWHNKNSGRSRTVRVSCPIEVGCAEKRLWIKLPSGRQLSYPDACGAYYFEKNGVVIKAEKGNEDAACCSWTTAQAPGDGLRCTAASPPRTSCRRSRAICWPEQCCVSRLAGYRVVAHIHDEIVIEAPLKHAARIQKDFTRLMMVTPDWAEGLPIMVNSWANRRYVK